MFDRVATRTIDRFDVVNEFAGRKKVLPKAHGAMNNSELVILGDRIDQR